MINGGKGCSPAKRLSREWMPTKCPAQYLASSLAELAIISLCDHIHWLSPALWNLCRTWLGCRHKDSRTGGTSGRRSGIKRGTRKLQVPRLPHSSKAKPPSEWHLSFHIWKLPETQGPRGDQLLVICTKLRGFLGLGNSYVKTAKSQVSQTSKLIIVGTRDICCSGWNFFGPETGSHHSPG